MKMMNESDNCDDEHNDLNDIEEEDDSVEEHLCSEMGDIDRIEEVDEDNKMDTLSMSSDGDENKQKNKKK